MRVTWVTSVIQPRAAEALHLNTPPDSGGWIHATATKLPSDIALNIISFAQIPRAVITENGNIIYTVLPSKNALFKSDPSLCKKLEQTISSFSPDIIDIQGIEFFYSLPAIAAAGLRPTAATIQGLTSECHKYFYQGLSLTELLWRRTIIRDYLLMDGIIERKRKYMLRGMNEVETIKNLSHVIGRTSWDRTAVLQHNPSITYHKCNRIIQSEFYSHHWNPSQMRQGTIYISQSHYPIKGLHVFLDALKIVKQQYPGVQVRIAGKNMTSRKTLRDKLLFSGYQNIISNKIQSHGLSDNIQFLGPLRPSQVALELAEANIYVLPSLIENSPNSLAEAQIVGTPAIGTYTGGVPDYISHGVTGLIYNPMEPHTLARHIILLLKNRDLCVALSSKAKSVAMQRHCPSHNIAELISAYESIINCNRRGV